MIRRNKRCRSPSPPTRRKNPNDGLWVEIRKEIHESLLIYKRALEILREEGLLPSTQPPNDSSLVTWSPIDTKTRCKHLDTLSFPQPIPCMMFSSYRHEFPALERKTNLTTKLGTKWTIQQNEVLPNGKLKPLRQAKEILNW